MVDLDKFICSLLNRVDNPLEIVRAGGIFHALKVQGLEYKDGAIKPIKEPVNFEEFPREEQLKWYICIKPIPQKDGGFMPLFCEGEHATIEKIFDMLPELKRDTALFTEHFRKVTDADLSKESDTESFDYEHATIKQKDFATTKKTDIEIKVGDWCVDKEGWYGGKPFKKIGENTKDKMLNGEMGTFFKAQFQDGSTFFPNVEHVRKATEAEIPVDKPSTIKFDEPDIDEMVEKYRKANEYELLSLGYSLGYLETLCNAYRRGLKEMYKYLKKGEEV